MGHWGWRRLLAVFISVWVVGCTITHEAAPTLSPTSLPEVTLIAYVPITPTPLPTQSVTPFLPVSTSPTPMTYSVQEGDTLLQIAQRFGVSVGALQTVNGGIEPNALQIGQLLIIPEPRFNVDGQPVLSAPTPLPLPLSPPRCFTTPTDTVVCIGQVNNSSETFITRVGVLVHLLNSEGQMIASGETSIEQAIIPPGSSAPYRLLIRANGQAFEQASAYLFSADAAPLAANQYVLLEVENLQPTTTGGQYQIAGTLYNPGSSDAQVQRAVLTLRDAAGQITGYRVAPLRLRLAAGERIPFTINAQSWFASPVSHDLYVEAVRVP